MSTWPPGFASQTTNPSSRFFVGCLPAKEKQTTDAPKAPNGRKLIILSIPWRIYDLIRSLGPLPRSTIASHLNVPVRHVDQTTLRLVKDGVLMKAKTDSESIYSIGAAPVVEVELNEREDE